MALGATWLLTQEEEPIWLMIVDDCNGFIELSRLAMMWTVRRHWLTGASFTFNFYKYWVQLLLRHPGEPPVIIMGREGVTQGDPLLMVLYGITLLPLV